MTDKGQFVKTPKNLLGYKSRLFTHVLKQMGENENER